MADTENGDNRPKIKYNDYPWEEVLKTAQEEVLKGHEVYQKFTCQHCGARQTMETPNRFYTEGKCEECKKITDIKKHGHNYMLYMRLGKDK